MVFEMKRATTFALELALGLAAAPPVSAEGEFTTGELLQACNGTSPSRNQSYCFGFVLGAYDVMHANGNMVDANKNPLPGNGVSTCSDEPVRADAMVQAFRKWAERNPKDWGKPADVGVINALHETWPCK